MTLLDTYRSRLNRAEQQYIRDQKKVSDLADQLVTKRSELSRTTSSTRQKSIGRQLDSLSKRHVQAQKAALAQYKKVADLKKKVQNAEENERREAARQQKKVDRENERVRKSMEQNIDTTTSQVAELHARVSNIEEALLSSVHDAIVADYADREFDLYLLHAGPDFEASTELFEALTAAGLSVWFDEDNKVTLGRSVFRQLNAGNRCSHAGVMLVTKAALEERFWLESEVGSFFSTQRRLIPILHGIDRDDLKRYSPFLADLKGLSTDDHDFDEIALMITQTLRSAEEDAVTA